MKVHLDLKRGICELIKEDTDPTFSGVVNAKGESRLLYHLKGELQKQGHKVIKKRMHKDGHLVNDMQQYVRTTSRKSGFMIYNPRWAIHGAEEEFNKDGRVFLAVEIY